MKKTFKTIALAAALFCCGTAFAYPTDIKPGVTEEAKTAFQKTFAGAADVSWKEINGFYFANFKQDNTYCGAAYDETGALLGTSKEMAAADLPLVVKESLERRYGAYTIGELVTQIEFEGTTSYFVTAKSKDRTLKLKCFSEGGISVEKKTKH